ncbi:hypothetical protein BRADI_1g18165v3, partial [Brachypodium distachyon]
PSALSLSLSLSLSPIPFLPSVATSFPPPDQPLHLVPLSALPLYLHLTRPSLSLPLLSASPPPPSPWRHPPPPATGIRPPSHSSGGIPGLSVQNQRFSSEPEVAEREQLHVGVDVLGPETLVLVKGDVEPQLHVPVEVYHGRSPDVIWPNVRLASQRDPASHAAQPPDLASPTPRRPSVVRYQVRRRLTRPRARAVGSSAPDSSPARGWRGGARRCHHGDAGLPLLDEDSVRS